MYADFLGLVTRAWCHDNVWALCYAHVMSTSHAPVRAAKPSRGAAKRKKATATAPKTRTEKLDLRVRSAVKAFLRRAADVTGRSLTDFVIESAVARAEEALTDRVRFNLSAEQGETFLKALDAPARTHPRMQRLLNEPGFFDQ
jgi:uncharacterized protein (DUF1778 family)